MIDHGTNRLAAFRGLSRRPFIFRVLGLVLLTGLLGASAASAVRLNGEEYVSLSVVAERFGMEHQWISPGSQAKIGSRWSDLRFTVHQKDFTYNGTKVYLGGPVVYHNRQLHIPEIDYQSTLKPLFYPQQFEPKRKLYRIVIDPGHGGKDSGALNNALKLKEKYLALDLANRVKNRLEKLGYKVSLTRTDDTFIGLSERAAIANRAGADLFLSLHFNAVDAASVDGIETFIMTPAGHASTNSRTKDHRNYAGNADEPWSMLAGYYIQSNMIEKTGADDRGLKRARFAVLKDLKMPGVLVEGGFVTHPTEGRNIGSSAYRDKLADGIVEGVLEYQKALNRARGIDS